MWPFYVVSHIVIKIKWGYEVFSTSVAVQIRWERFCINVCFDTGNPPFWMVYFPSDTSYYEDAKDVKRKETSTATYRFKSNIGLWKEKIHREDKPLRWNIQKAATKDRILDINLKYIEKAAHAHFLDDTALVQDHSYADTEHCKRTSPLCKQFMTCFKWPFAWKKKTSCNEASRLLCSVKFMPQIPGEIEVAEHKNVMYTDVTPM